MRSDAMQRREFITLLGGAAAAWPIAAGAQQPDRMRRIGVLMGYAEGDSEAQTFVAAFREGLEGMGWKDGRNIHLSFCWTAGDPDRNRSCAVELAGLAPDVILSTSTTPTAALGQATHTIPIVFATAIDPMSSGLVGSLAHPGGNITGFSNYEYDIGGKWLEVLKETAPSVSRIAFVMNPSSANHAGILRSIETAARSMGVQVTAAGARDAIEIERGVEAFSREPGGGLIIPSSPITTAHRALIIALAARHRLPSVYPYRLFADDGGLISYGVDIPDIFRHAAGYVDRILRGEKPGDLPVQQPTKFELVVNLKTAKALGLEIPESFLLRADEVIE